MIPEGEVLAERFVVLRRIGAGGMGEVYEAEDRKLGGRVAIKAIRPENASDEQAMARLRREVLVARQVTHPSVCRVYDLVQAERTFLTMEFLAGETLSAYIQREGPLPLEKALPIIDQITAGLDAAHEARILHRDFKSSNVILTKDAGGGLRAVITDFGLARSTASGETMTTRFARTGEEPSTASDIYALGVVMYEMATGASPTGGALPAAAGADYLWATAILKCMAADPANRFATAGAVAEAVGGGRRIAIPRFRPGRGVRGLRWAIAAAVVLLGAGGWLFRDEVFVPALPADVAHLYDEAVTAIADGVFVKAKDLLELVIQKKPDFAAAHCRLAEAYQELDYRDRARESAMRSLDHSARGTSDRLLCEATRAYLSGDWAKALSTMERRANRYLEAKPVLALLDVAHVLDRVGRTKDAIASYRAVLARDSSQPGAALRLANLLLNGGDRKNADPLLEQVETFYRVMGKNEGLAMVALTRAEFATEVPKKIGFAQQAEKLAPENSSLRIRARLRIGDAKESRGEAEEARKLAAEAVEIAQSSGLGSLAVMGLIDLGYVPFTQRRYEEAEQYWQQALQVAQRFGARRGEARAKAALAQLYSRTNRPERSFPLLESAMKFYDETGNRGLYLQVLRFRGDVYRQQSKYAEARSAYQMAERQSDTVEDKMNAKSRMALLAQLQGRYVAAAHLYREIAVWHKTTGARNLGQDTQLQLARVLNTLGQFEECAALLDELRRAPSNKGVAQDVEYEQANLDFQRGDFSKSLSSLERLQAQAQQAGQRTREEDFRLELCPKYAEAGRFDEGAVTCGKALVEMKDRPARLVTVYYGLAEIALGRRNSTDAVRHAREAVRLAAESNNLRNEWYSLLVLAQALHAAGHKEWMAARERSAAVLAEIAKEEGQPAMATYLKRPVIDRRWQEVQKLN